MNLFEYLEGRTPFSTQHKVKGNVFERIFVALGNWNLYNFEHLFSESGTASFLERSRKIFYVCCTRAREEIVVYSNGPSTACIEKAKQWFGEDKVICVDQTADQADSA
jgi:DNA helicase-2/ATP-dependent DNA helicase PcrA